jgi:hypothetical protein
MLVPCGFSNAGCKEKVPYAGKRAHEAAYCHHAPCVGAGCRNDNADGDLSTFVDRACARRRLNSLSLTHSISM